MAMVTSSTRRVRVALLLLFIAMVLGFNVKHINGFTISSTSLLPGTSLLQTDSDTTVPFRHRDDDTVRVDPLDKLKKYRGGFDITNKHYWSSTLFTGVYGYSIGLLWLLSGVWYGCYLVASTLCCKQRNPKKISLGYTQSYLYPILLAAFFTILAIVGSGLVIGGNAKFHSEAKSVVEIIVETANEASGTIFNTTTAMTDMKKNMEASNGITETSLFLAETSQRLGDEAADIELKATKNRRLIIKGLNILYVITSVIVSLTMVAVIALSVIGILRLPRALNMLIVLCWGLTALCWLLFGVYFSLDRFAIDACRALDSFEENPNNNSLSSILPCNELLSAKPLLFEVSAGIYNLVDEVNAKISIQTELTPINIRICNPFSAPPEYQYQPENCPEHSIRIGDIPQELQVLFCADLKDEACTGALMSTSGFQSVEAYTRSIQELLNVYPGMEDLVECRSVKEAFSEILGGHCEPLKRNLRLVWGGLVFLAAVMVVLVLTWTVKAQYEQLDRFADGSVKPHIVVVTEVESGIVKDVGNDSNPGSVL